MFHQLSLMNESSQFRSWVGYTPSTEECLSASTAKQKYLSKLRTECHHGVLGVLETNCLTATSSELEDDFRRMLGDTLHDLALLHL